MHVSIHDLRKLKASIARGYTAFCHKRGLDPDDIFDNGMGDLRRAHKLRMQARAKKLRKAP